MQKLNVLDNSVIMLISTTNLSPKPVKFVGYQKNIAKYGCFDKQIR